MTASNAPQLIVDGEVERACSLSAADLALLPAEHQIADVSQIEPKRMGRGVWLSGLLQTARARPTATHVTLHASADDFHASVPLAEVADRAFLIYGVDEGAAMGALPTTAGGPFRFFIRDHAACQAAEVDECANVKFVDRIELTAGPGQDNRPHDEAEHAKLHEK
ncbi:MAG: molybdopterin-dependent oxidoreductase [Pirellulales bacterium]